MGINYGFRYSCAYAKHTSDPLQLAEVGNKLRSILSSQNVSTYPLLCQIYTTSMNLSFIPSVVGSTEDRQEIKEGSEGSPKGRVPLQKQKQEQEQAEQEQEQEQRMIFL